jgi:hypothetical protein
VKRVGGVSNRTVDVESGTAIFPASYMENNCTSDTIDGYGVELDWVRHFWDLHTGMADLGRYPTCTGASFDTIMALIDDVDDWSDPLDAFEELDTSATLWLDPSISSCWPGSASGNGVDWPQ